MLGLDRMGLDTMGEVKQNQSLALKYSRSQLKTWTSTTLLHSCPIGAEARQTSQASN